MDSSVSGSGSTTLRILELLMKSKLEKFKSENLNDEFENMYTVYTGSCKDNRIVSEEMSSWTALTMHLGIKKFFF